MDSTRSAKVLRPCTIGAIGALWVALTAASNAAPVVAQTGRPAPAFVLQSAGDRVLTLRTFARKPLVINVFASWCPPCRAELPGIVAAARAAHGTVAFLGVDEQEPVEIGRRFAGAMKIPYAIGFDPGQFAASYGANALPVTIFIDANGIVRSVHHGAISSRELGRRISAIASRP